MSKHEKVAEEIRELLYEAGYDITPTECNGVSFITDVASILSRHYGKEHSPTDAEIAKIFQMKLDACDVEDALHQDVYMCILEVLKEVEP